MGKGKNKAKKNRMGSIRAKIGAPAKSGKRRPSNIHSKIDAYGKRHWYDGKK